MKVREGLMPTVLNTALTATSLTLNNRRKKVHPVIGWSIVALNASQVIMEACSLVRQRR
ncbi:hypothetical protein [Alicyclobacillus fodiniaquatilis]|jgi:hypothetical protein|uniref:Uncharacterized protein n=1 Tax=Alicyclobacillus fodiniaquatilis TaxID=1661150 RepID=A0ABW4JG78_9BACL